MWRATLKNLLAKKVRLVLTALSVVLGVGFMAALSWGWGDNLILAEYGINVNTFETVFLADWSVEVVSNSGFGRSLSWCVRP